MKLTFKYDYTVDSDNYEDLSSIVNGIEYKLVKDKWFSLDGVEVVDKQILAELNQELYLKLEEDLFKDLWEYTKSDIIHCGGLTSE